MSSLFWLGVAFAFVWVTLAAYLVRLWIGHRRLAERVAALEARRTG